jgi:signal transduction histidine kinase
MSFRSIAAASRSRSSLVVAVLVATLGVTTMLAYEVNDATHSHRVTAERALRDYAGVAAFDFLSSAQSKSYLALVETFTPITGVKATSPYETLLPPSTLQGLAAGMLPCDGGPDHRWYFRVDFRDNSIATSGPLPAENVVRQLVDSVSTHARTAYSPDWRYAMLYASAGGEEHTVAYSVRYAEHNAPLAAYGFEACHSTFGPVLFDKIMHGRPLLAGVSLRGVPNDSLFSVVVKDAADRVIYRSAMQYPSPFTGKATLDSWGGLCVTVALRPDAVQRLVIGPLPKSKVPLLLSLVAMSAGLVTAAVMQLRREAELARLRTGFVSSVSHELRTPLAQIRMFSETLRLGRVRSEQERMRSLEIIDQESRRLTHLVENVLQFARAERRELRVHPESVALAHEVADVVETCAPLVSARKMRIIVECEGCESTVVRADRGALRQVLINLVDNAVKYGPQGQAITVRVEGGDSTARVTVEDEGPGVAPRERERIWDPFYRMERDAMSAVAGSGIGLSVVRDLMREQGGRVWVESTRTGSARFIVELPLVKDVAPVVTV